MVFVLRILINALALWVATRIVPGLSFDGPVPMLVAVALVFAVVNAIVRPILKILTFPALILTLGLFYFILNGILLWMVSWFIPGYRVSGESFRRGGPPLAPNARSTRYDIVAAITISASRSSRRSASSRSCLSWSPPIGTIPTSARRRPMISSSAAFETSARAHAKPELATAPPVADLALEVLAARGARRLPFVLRGGDCQGAAGQLRVLASTSDEQHDVDLLGVIPVGMLDHL